VKPGASAWGKKKVAIAAAEADAALVAWLKCAYVAAA
jgi:hypothetical protein